MIVKIVSINGNGERIISDVSDACVETLVFERDVITDEELIQSIGTKHIGSEINIKYKYVDCYEKYGRYHTVLILKIKDDYHGYMFRDKNVYLCNDQGKTVSTYRLNFEEIDY